MPRGEGGRGEKEPTGDQPVVLLQMVLDGIDLSRVRRFKRFSVA
jgi:hypothetical protein